MESCLNYSCLERQSLSLSILFVRFYSLNLVKRARLPNYQILLTRHDFVTSPRPVASLGVPAIATLGVLHVRQHVNELFCGEAGIEPLLAPKNRYPTYWFFYSVALPLSYSPYCRYFFFLWCSSNASSASTMILRPICVTALSITPLSFILIAVPLEQENNSHKPFSPYTYFLSVCSSLWVSFFGIQFSRTCMNSLTVSCQIGVSERIILFCFLSFAPVG